MSKKHFFRAGIALIVILLLASVGLNAILYRRGYDYYLELNAVHLDPLGLNSYPTSRQQSINPNVKPLVVFFGDSRAEAWTMPIQTSNLAFINRGIGSQTTAQVLGRFAYHVLSLKPRVIVLQVGINDLKAIPLFPNQKDSIVAHCKANIKKIVEVSVQNNTEVVLTTIFPLGKIPLERQLFWSDDVAAAIKDVNRFIASLEGDRVKIFDTEKVLSKSGGIIDPIYSRDFLHINEKGYEVLNRELIRFLNR